MAKERLDILLKSEFGSREKARRAIMSGIVFVDNQRIDKPGTMVSTDATIDIRGKKLPYVSRGGLKLEKGINKYEIDLKNKICMDIGASTGGFTDCMLQNNASKVYSVDVGYGQLDWKLRNDERVVNLERTNIRYINVEDIDDLDFITIDVSFISLYHVLKVAKDLLKENGELLFLIKPQFEAGKDKVKKGGVVKDSEVHREVLEKIVSLCTENGFSLIDITYSPIKGPKGNIEFLGYAVNNNHEHIYNVNNIESLVLDAKNNL